MKTFNKFYFRGFDFDKTTLVAKFYYSFDNEVNFCETINFACQWFTKREKLNLDIINNILFHISIALWIGYYKAYPTKELILTYAKLNKEQINFWQKFYKKWLWEFLYKNKLDPTHLFQFKNETKKEFKKIDFSNSEKYLLPIWWGKDSLVSAEILKEKWLEFDLITFWKDYPIHQKTSESVGKNRILITRKMDDKLFEMNKNWYYNGHVPISGIIAFVLELVSYIYDYKYIIMSNEKSANYGNTQRKWLDINHQYSKSLEFEKDLNKYVELYISSQVKYFSILRWMYEVKIAKLFSQYKQYFDTFSSCNSNFRINQDWKNPRWCNNCPKCVFVYSILRPYISHKETIEIFGEELFEKIELKQLFKELLWIDGIKPFECVWTNEEMILSLYYSYNIFQKEKLKQKKSLLGDKIEVPIVPIILKIFQKEVLDNLDENYINQLERKLFSNYESLSNLYIKM